MTARRWPAVAWTALLVLVLVVPGRAAAGAPNGADKLAHVVLFAGFAWLWLRVAPRSTGITALVGAALAIATEVAQSTLLHTRSGDLWDVVADLVGLVLGVALFKAHARQKAPDGMSGTGRAHENAPTGRGTDQQTGP